MASELAKLATIPCASPRPFTSRKVGEFLLLSHRGLRPAPEGASPAIIFQVFWLPPRLEFPLTRKDRAHVQAVLLGEVLVPPLRSLGAEYRVHRLPLQRSRRQPPEGVISYEQWREEFLPSYMQRLRGPHDYSQKRQMFKNRAQHLMRGHDDDVACEGSPCSLQSQRPPPPPTAPRRRPMGWSGAQTQRLQVQDPIPMQDGEVLSALDDALWVLPTTFRGSCYLDVDLAFVGLSELEQSMVDDYYGTFAFQVHALRVPPLNDGCVRIQVCEVGSDVVRDEAADFVALQGPCQCKTPNGAALEGILPQQRHIEAFESSYPVHSLWWSSGRTGFLGTRDESPCTATWSGPPVSVWVSVNEDVRQRRYRNYVLRSGGQGQRCPIFGAVHLVCPDYEWEPLRLLVGDILPRPPQRIHAIARLDPSRPLTARHSVLLTP